MIDNKLNFFFKHQIWHLGGTVALFYIGIPFAFAAGTGSQSMFIVAIYIYISIWLHYFCTEKEDFKVIYEKS